jgi:hypothetical protein
MKQFQPIVAYSETQEFSASQKQPIKELALMIKILYIGSPRMLSGHFRVQDNIFQARNKAKIKFLNEIKKSKQAGLNPFTYYYTFPFEMFPFFMYVYTVLITASLVNVGHTDIDKKKLLPNNSSLIPNVLNRFKFRI